MRFSILTALMLVSTRLAFAEPSASTEVGFAEVRALGTLNGHALACRQFEASSAAKDLMIKHAPKTRRYGSLFETATNAAFLAATKDGAPCPSETDLATRLTQAAHALKAVFPQPLNPESSQTQPPKTEPPLSSDTDI